jgi:hypothetical protein
VGWVVARDALNTPGQELVVILIRRWQRRYQRVTNIFQQTLIMLQVPTVSPILELPLTHHITSHHIT